MDENKTRFVTLFAKELNVEKEELLGSSLLETKEFDSMGKINISLMIEHEFNWQIPFEVLDEADNIEQIWDAVKANAKN